MHHHVDDAGAALFISMIQELEDYKTIFTPTHPLERIANPELVSGFAMFKIYKSCTNKQTIFCQTIDTVQIFFLSSVCRAKQWSDRRDRGKEFIQVEKWGNFV